MIYSRACGVVLEGWERVVRVDGRLRRSRLALLRLRDENVGARRRRLDSHSRGGRLRLRARGLRYGGARPGAREGGLSRERSGDENGRTRSPAMMQRASRSIVSLLLNILSSIRDSATSSSLCLRRWKERGTVGEVKFNEGPARVL